MFHDNRAASVIIASEDALKAHNLKPLARVVGYHVSGVEPTIMGIGPVPAIRLYNRILFDLSFYILSFIFHILSTLFAHISNLGITNYTFGEQGFAFKNRKETRGH